MEPAIFYGEVSCRAKVKSTGKDCANNAYYKEGNSYLCGVHSNKDKRVKLMKNPNKKNIMLDAIKVHNDTIELVRQDNKDKELTGNMKCHKMAMMKPVPLVGGYLNVFPNFKHNNRSDGYGCSALSPMSLGPVYMFIEQGLPIAKNIENFHQNRKIWPNEVDDNGDPTKEALELQIKMYNDPIPHRHKYDAKEMAKLRKQVDGENRNQPLYSIHRTLKGELRRYTYVESRFFYCTAYEILAKQQKEFGVLQEYIKNGTNIMICGYDAYDVTMTLYEHYCDPTKPFGHELVLYTLLMIQDETEYPWRQYRSNYPEIYEDIVVSV